MMAALALRRLGTTVGGLAAVLAVWYAGAGLFVAWGDPLAESKMPYPHLVAERVIDSWSTLWEATLTTVVRAGQGLVLGILVAVVLCVLMVQARWVESALMPYVLAAQMLPLIALVPIAQNVFEDADTTRLFIAAFVTVLSITLALLRGLRSPSAEALELMDSYAVGSWRTLILLRFPAAMPLFFSGLRVAVPLSLVGSILVDLAGAQSGLGYLMITSLTFGPSQATMLWAAMVMTLVAALLATRLLGLIEALLPWKAASTEEARP